MIFCFVDKDILKITPLIGVDKIDSTTAQYEDSVDIKVSNEVVSNREILKWPLTILLIGIVAITITIWIFKKQIS